MKMKKIRINIDITINDEEKKVYRIPKCSIKRAAGNDFDLDKAIEDSLNKDCSYQKKEDVVKSMINKTIVALDKLKGLL